MTCKARQFKLSSHINITNKYYFSLGKAAVSMEIRFNVIKEERKALVKALGEFIGCKPVYKGAPSFAFDVKNYTIDRYGTLVYDERTDAKDLQNLLAQLSAQGFIGEGITDFTTPPEPTAAQTLGKLRSVVDESGINLTIEVPLVGFTPTTLDNLDRLVTGKAWLIKKAIGAEELPIERTETTLRFPWFPVISSYLEVDAYSRFIHALCEMAKRQKRVMLKEKPINKGDSDRFAFRCFLLRLDFIGKEYASARKILLSKLSGNGSFRRGDRKGQSALILE
jgi:hypothetical protein